MEQLEYPTRFTYYNNLDCAAHKLLSLVGRFLFGVKDIEMPKERVMLHAAAMMKADELADRVAQDVYFGGKGGPALFNKVMKEGLDIDEEIPDSLRELYTQVTTEPEWLDRERLKRGIATQQRLGRVGLYGLATMGLLAGYNNPELGRPLIATGALTGDGSFNRINYTSAFWMEVTEDGGLDMHAKGFSTAVHVRIKHALVRHQLMNDEDNPWNIKDWGLPINTSDSAITNVGFSSMIVMGSRMTGFRVTNKEYEDILHMWRYVGYLMGDDDRLLPKTVEEGMQALGFVAAGNDNIPNEGSIRLGNDFLESFKQKGRGSFLEFTGFFKNLFYRCYASFMIPGPQHRALKLPGSYGLWLWIPLFQTPLIFLLDNFRHYTKVFNPLFKKLGRRGQNIFITNRFKIADSSYKNLSSNEDIIDKSAFKK